MDDFGNAINYAFDVFGVRAQFRISMQAYGWQATPSRLSAGFAVDC
jgi:hypothetical protein